MLLDDPTRGVDLGTKADLYQLFRGLADAGPHGPLVFDRRSRSSCMRPDLVLRDGAIVAEFPRDQMMSEERLIEASFRSVEDGAAADPMRRSRTDGRDSGRPSSRR